MSKSTKALLLSALVFPGVGHLFLQKRIRGAVLAIISLVCLYILVTRSIDLAQSVSAQIQSGDIPFDINRISNELTKSDSEASGAFVFAMYLLQTCWLVGVIDAFRVGRAQDKTDAVRNDT